MENDRMFPTNHQSKFNFNFLVFNKLVNIIDDELNNEGVKKRFR